MVQWLRVFTYTIADYSVYTSSGYHTYLRPISQKTFWLSKISINFSYMQSFRQIASKLWKIEAIQNRYPIVVYGVMSKNSGQISLVEIQ